MEMTLNGKRTKMQYNNFVGLFKNAAVFVSLICTGHSKTNSRSFNYDDDLLLIYHTIKLL